MKRKTFEFSASPDEIDRIVESKQLNPANRFTQTAIFYWWKPQMCKGCKYFESKEGSEWAWLYYNPESKDVYCIATTF